MTLANNRQETGTNSDDEPMGTPAQIGGYDWKAEIAEARVVKAELRTLVRRALEQRCDAALLGQMALKLGELDDAINRLGEISKNTK